MIGLEQILGFIGVKPEAIAQLREMITPEKVEAGLAQLKALEGRLIALEEAITDIRYTTAHLLRLAHTSPNPPAPPVKPSCDPGFFDPTPPVIFDTSEGAQVGSREGETIPPVFQLEMDKQLALMLRENGVMIDDDGSSGGRGSGTIQSECSAVDDGSRDGIG